jgi:Fuc2NAc and GlcNAc transferase
MDHWLLLFGSLGSAWALTGLVIMMARRADLIDVPNARSSHQQPTPRGGGLAIVVSLAAASPWLVGADPASVRLAASIVPAALAVAVIGLIDDRWQLPAWPRAAVQAASASWILYSLPSLPVVEVFGMNLGAGTVGAVLALFYLVWATNLFNFMDGIDGIAASQTILICGGAALLQWQHIGGTAWLGPVLVACSCCGFLAWNWPPARIFMGDVGSGFLGLLVGGMTLSYSIDSPSLFWAWMILQGTFMVDATVTLVCRLVRGQRVTQAHRSHAYQHLACRFGHRKVTLAYAVTTLLWLLPLAYTVASGTLGGPLGMVLAYLPLAVAALLIGAGGPELGISIQAPSGERP